jgi:hypothetical protein
MTRSLDTDDPEFYVELLSQLIPQSERRSHMLGRCLSVASGDPQLQELLDALALVIMKHPENPAAVAASLSSDRVKIYLTFNTDEDGVEDHLKAILRLLRQVHQKVHAPQEESPWTSRENTPELEELIRIVHDFCWESFAKRVSKGRLALEEARMQLARFDDMSPVYRSNDTWLLDTVAEIIRLFEECQTPYDIGREFACKLSDAYRALLDKRILPDVHKGISVNDLRVIERRLRKVVCPV